MLVASMSLTEAACSVNMTVVCKTSKHHLYVPADSMTVYVRTVLGYMIFTTFLSFVRCVVT